MFILIELSIRDRSRRQIGDPYSCVRERRRNLVHSLSTGACFQREQEKSHTVEAKMQINGWYDIHLRKFSADSFCEHKDCGENFG